MKTMLRVHFVLAFVLIIAVSPCSSAEQTQSLNESALAGAEAEELGVKIERNVPVPMRDGTILRADVHRPDRGGPYPVLVQRTPYGKDKTFDQFVRAGYIVVCQDARGRYESEGKWESASRFETHDAEDGYDTVEWAAKLPRSTSKVGTFGMSYDAFLQWRLAPLHPPSLMCMSAYMGGAASLTDAVGPAGIRPGLAQWRAMMAADRRRRENMPGVHTVWEAKKLWEKDSEKWIYWLPWLELPGDFFGYETDAEKHWFKNPHIDPWKLDEGIKEITVPNLDITGWYDYGNDDMRLFRTMIKEARTEVARKGSRIIIGPWSHSPRLQRRYGDIDFGPDASMDRIAMQIRWFDYWLKGKQNGAEKDAPVRIFVMGDNQWRDEQHWPLRRTKKRILFITSDGHANTPRGDGKLVIERPESSNTDKYVYDPKDPVPTPKGTQKADQRSLANRQDILVYLTEPLAERLEVTGNPVVELYAASSAPDTDWFVRLIDVAPDGLARAACSGMVRARYRKGLDRPKLIKPGEVVKYTIRMGPTSNAFLPGHRIRLDITSSDFPFYERNHNTAANQYADATLVTAKQTIYHGSEQATRIILPWVPNPTEAERPSEEEFEPEPEKQVYPLHQAAADGDIEQVKLLISKGANVNAEDEEKKTPLHYAAETGKMEVVKLLVEAGADINAGEGKWTVLHGAVYEGRRDIAELLIQKGADVNIKDRNGHQPLFNAIWKKDLDTLKLLINKGANVNIEDRNGHQPLYNAVWKKDLDIAKLLIAKGADVNAGEGKWTALHGAVDEGLRDIAELLIQKGANVNTKGKGGYQPLHYALWEKDLDTVKLLITKGADVNAKGNDGVPLLHHALSMDSNDVAKLLLAEGADFAWKDKSGLTALHYAAVNEYQDIANLLLTKGAKVDAKDDVYEFTALHYAARFGSKNVAEILIANDADIKAKDEWDYQPIHWAAHHDRADVVELLLSKGADVNAKTSLGQTPLQLAKPRRNTATVKVLRKHGAKE
jgi:putative CocE/NonD family hydrolase